MKGKVDILLGLQWGDEGKGKVVDYITPNYNHVARFQGGPNAGHTLKFDNNTVVLRSIPSGIFQCNGKNIIGNGVVFDPILFRQEFEELSKYVNADKLSNSIIISSMCHVITPFHKLQDMINEIKKGDKKVGTTGKGIGPTYTDKSARIGIPLKELIYSSSIGEDCFSSILSNFRSSLNGIDLQSVPDDKRDIIRDLGSDDELLVKYAVRLLLEEFIHSLVWLKKSNILITNTTNYINSELINGSSILAEGAQGTMLDVDFGTYPYVTSSNTISAGACIGLGIAPNKIGEIYGIFKAYCTRVGAGPFPTEQDNEIGESIRKEGHEFGAVTGRNRRCGWLDLVQLKYACMINGVTKLIMTKSDVLSIFDRIKVCTSYMTKNGENINGYPNNLSLYDIIPQYTEFDGWKGEKFYDCYNYADFPETFKAYIKFIENYLEVPIYIISVGPGRTQTLKIC